jgi:hypothetical protein
MHHQLSYVPTLMEKLLGRNYKWWYFLKYNFTIATVGIFGNIYQFSGFFLEALVVFYVWYSNGNPGTVVTYLLIGRVYKSIVENYFYNSFGGEVISGKITSKILTPQPVIAYF